MLDANARPHPQDPLEPVPAPGCGVCAALAETRRLAWAVGNLPAVAVQNAELANHPHTLRAVFRFVEHVMRRHPSAETTATARCLHPDCRWRSAPSGSADSCSDMCIAHTGRTGHITFVREFSEVAVVERVG